jgi:hypothetical protein
MKKLKALWILATSKHYFLSTSTDRGYYCTSSTNGNLENFTEIELRVIMQKRKEEPATSFEELYSKLANSYRLSTEEIKKQVEDVCPCAKCVARRTHEKQKQETSN